MIWHTMGIELRSQIQIPRLQPLDTTDPTNNWHCYLALLKESQSDPIRVEVLIISINAGFKNAGLTWIRPLLLHLF